MADGANTKLIKELLKIGYDALAPIAKEKFYEYRDRVLDAAEVSPEEREALLAYVFDEPEP